MQHQQRLDLLWQTNLPRAASKYRRHGEMMAAKIVTVEEAETCLRELIGLAEQGAEVVITQGAAPKVKLAPVGQVPQKRRFGQHRGKIWMHPDFDAPLPDHCWLSDTL
jgi:antitoxin (DNA-binding transcriptional repressor) of toxin-antitoxin stability system